MIQFSNICFFLSASLSSLSLIFSAFVFVTFVEKPNLKIDGMQLLCMMFVFFLFVDGDAVLPDLVGSEFVSFKLLRLGLGFLKLYWSLPPKSSQASSAHSITIESSSPNKASVWWGLKSLRSSTHKYLSIIWSLVTMTSLYGRWCSYNHVGMSILGMSELAVLSLLHMSHVCSVPCLDTNQT